MKWKKKITACLLAVCVVFSLAACGGSEDEERTVVLRGELTSNGIPVTDTVTITAIGDKVQNQQEVLEFDFSGFDFSDEERVLITEAVTNLFESTYEDIDAITIEDISITDATLTLTLSFDYSGDITELKEAGLLESQLFEDNVTYISLIKTQQNLEAQGYREVTE